MHFLVQQLDTVGQQGPDRRSLLPRHPRRSGPDADLVVGQQVLGDAVQEQGDGHRVRVLNFGRPVFVRVLVVDRRRRALGAAVAAVASGRPALLVL